MITYACGMTVLEQVRSLLARMRPKAICDDCIADELKLTVRQHANHKTVALAKEPGFDRRVGPCAICKRSDKKVIRA